MVIKTWVKAAKIEYGLDLWLRSLRSSLKKIKKNLIAQNKNKEISVSFEIM